VVFFALVEAWSPSQYKQRYCELVPGPVMDTIQCYPEPVGCGKTWWAENERIYVDLPPVHQLRSRMPESVTPEEFQQRAAEIKRALSLPDNAAILPGATIGHLELEIVHDRIVDVSSPYISALIVTGRFVEFLSRGGFTGWHTGTVRACRHGKRRHGNNETRQGEN
jgi:hypothetical protein